MRASQLLTEKIKELHFDAAHYLKSLAPCDHLHGHTYVVKDLEITGNLEGNVLVDFKELKDVMRDLDHGLLVPHQDLPYWEKIVKTSLPFKLNKIVPIEGEPTVERIGTTIARTMLSRFANVERVAFTLYEGINQGVRCELSR